MQPLFCSLRRKLPSVAVVLAAAAFLPLLSLRAETKATWTDAAELTLHGRGWVDSLSPYDRFPGRAGEIVRPPVWALSRDAAGLYVDFITDSPRVAARWSLTRERIGMAHMPATGVSGLDLYVWDARELRWRWLANGRPTAYPENEVTLVNNLPVKERQYRLYLPLYNGIASLAIGTDGGVRDAGPDPRKPVVIYGTSITQGASASRPGMAYPALLGRQLGRNVINLGFSGNARGEPEVAELLAELDPAVFVLDPLPNMSGPTVTPLLDEFITILRRKHPRTPIVLVESIVYANAHLVSSRESRHTDSSRQLREVWEARVEAGDRNLFLVAADQLLGADGEDTVDGTHPTDLGFHRMAEGLFPVIRRLLDRAGE